MSLRNNALRYRMKIEMIEKINNVSIDTLKRFFYETIDIQERNAVIQVAESLGHQELALNLMANITSILI